MPESMVTMSLICLEELVRLRVERAVARLQGELDETMAELERAQGIIATVAHVHGPKPWPHAYPAQHDLVCLDPSWGEPHPELCCAECTDATVHAHPCKTRRIADGGA